MIFKNWTEQHTNAFRKDAFTVKHTLNETGLFTDEALIDLLNKHPKSHTDVCTMGDSPETPFKFRTGDARGIDGALLLEAAKSGAIWINLRECMNMHPEYNAVLKTMYGDLAKMTKSKPYSARGGILISSPLARVPYHCDPTETILWHVRGHKRFYLYPNNEEYLPDTAYEAILFKDQEDLPYRSSMERDARIFDLTDSEMLTWPLNSPHRVENVTHCISVTTEYSSPESSLKNAVMYTNAVMRQKFGKNPKWADASQGEKILKGAFGRVLRKFGVLDSMKEQDFVTFKVNKSAPNFIEDISPVIRAF